MTHDKRGCIPGGTSSCAQMTGTCLSWQCSSRDPINLCLLTVSVSAPPACIVSRFRAQQAPRACAQSRPQATGVKATTARSPRAGQGEGEQQRPQTRATWRRARVTATFSRRSSAKNPTWPRGLERTRDMMMASFSRPWKPSTVPISTCAYCGLISLRKSPTYAPWSSTYALRPCSCSGS